MGRQQKSEDKRQTERFGFTCTAAEAKTIRTLAEAHGINQHGVFIRLAALGILPVDRSKVVVSAAATVLNATMPQDEVAKRIQEVQKRVGCNMQPMFDIGDTTYFVDMDKLDCYVSRDGEDSQHFPVPAGTEFYDSAELASIQDKRRKQSGQSSKLLPKAL